MKYTQGKIGRVFIAKVEHGDDLIKELTQLIEKENLEAGIFYVIGAIKEASLVAGPEQCTRPPVPIWLKFDDCREVLGIGTLFRDNTDEPVLHLHGALGKGNATLMGCLRGESEVYLVAEVIILEVTESGALKEYDPTSGFKMLKL